MKRVHVHEAKSGFSGLLAAVEQGGESFVICRHGTPVADLVPHRRSSRIKPDPALRRIRINDDPVAPLSPDEWPEGVQ